MIIDLVKYKRVFTFGCSFTQYTAPTWADIVFFDMPNAEKLNFGRSGAGNTLISNRIVQANSVYKFSETDLVLVMYTSPLREDRWINGAWHTHGNVFNQSYYDKNFVKNYCDPLGMLIRDLGILEISRGYVESLPCDSFQMIGADVSVDRSFAPDESFADNLQKINLLVDSVYAKFPDSRLTTNPVQSFPKLDNDGKSFSSDGHPNPSEYADYLRSVGIPISNEAIEYANAANQFMQTNKTKDEILLQFPEMEKHLVKSDKMFL